MRENRYLAGHLSLLRIAVLPGQRRDPLGRAVVAGESVGLVNEPHQAEPDSSLVRPQWAPVMQYSDREMSIMCFKHLLDLSLAFHTRRKTGEVLRILDRWAQTFKPGEAVADAQGLTGARRSTISSSYC